MSMSTLNLLSGLLTPDFLRTAARATGETEAGVSKALSAAFPTLLGSLVQSAGNTTMMNAVVDMMKQPAIAALLGPGGGVLGSVGSLLAPNATGGPVGSVAQSLLAALFGKNAASIAGAIGQLAGLKSAGSAGALLSLAAPMVLAALGNRLGKSLTGTALAVLLGQEKAGIMSAVPGALAGAVSALGAASAAPAMAAAASRAAAAGTVATPAGRVGVAAAAPAQAAMPSAASAARSHDDEPPQRSAFLGSILGLLLTGAIIAGLVFVLSQFNKRPAEPPPVPKASAPAPKIVVATPAIAAPNWG